MQTELFQDLVVSSRQLRGQRRRWIWPVSLALHTCLLALAILIPVLTSDEMPAPTDVVRAFFVEPAVAAPAVPPPPPPASRSLARRAAPVVPAASPSRAFTAPIDIPDQITEEPASDLGVEGGLPGGVEGGVAGGVIGGVVGGLLQDAPAVQPVRVGGKVREPRKLKEVPPVYPILARQARIQGVVVLDCILDAHGRVTDVRVVSGVPMLDEAAIQAVRQWAYTPTLVNGIPMPVQLTVTLIFRLGQA